MKRLVSYFLLSIAMLMMLAADPCVSRYSSADVSDGFVLDSVASRISVEVCAMSSSRSAFSVLNPMSWTLMWNVDSVGYDFVRLSEPRYDIGECFAAVVGRYCNGIESIADSVTVSDRLHRYPDAVWTRFDWSGEQLQVSCGTTSLHSLFSLPAIVPSGALCRVVGRGVDFESVVVESWPDHTSLLATDYTEQAIVDHALLTGDPLEGIWTYFDRDTDDSHARLGGRYRLGVIRDDATGEYLIIYLGGAVVNPDGWRTGMIKGRLVATPFVDQYTLQWYDSAMEQVDIDVDAYATLDNSALLTLAFPLYKTSFRLARAH